GCHPRHGRSRGSGPAGCEVIRPLSRPREGQLPELPSRGPYTPRIARTGGWDRRGEPGVARVFASVGQTIP
ncbi:MAG: hypothetical protein E6581_08865, partial [Cutibacterium granulosum]|nr:hypothetical protein [Cutibacterium granulosum]